MKLQKLNNLVRGDTWRFEIEVKLNSSAFNLTGSKVYFTVRSKLDNADLNDSEAVLTKETTTHTNAAQGKTVIEFTASETRDVKPGVYFYDVQVKDSSNKIWTVTYGQLSVVQDVTLRVS